MGQNDQESAARMADHRLGGAVDDDQGVGMMYRDIPQVTRVTISRPLTWHDTVRWWARRCLRRFFKIPPLPVFYWALYSVCISLWVMSLMGNVFGWESPIWISFVAGSILYFPLRWLFWKLSWAVCNVIKRAYEWARAKDRCE